MLIRSVVLVSVVALALALAACAEMAESMAASAAASAAEIAATQAEMATTQAIDQLQVAASQMSQRAQAGQNPFALPNLPPIHKGTMVLVLPNAIVIQKDGHRWIFPRSQLDYQNAGNVLPNDLQNPEEP
jgi:hypothetical protein